MELRLWISAAASLALLVAAGLNWSVAPASDCNTAHAVDWVRGLPFFALFLAAGAYVVGAGHRSQRLFVFLGSGLIVCGYAWGWSQSLPMVVGAEVACTAGGER